MTDLTLLGIAEAGRLLARGEITATALTESFLKRIEAVDSKISSYITVTADLARAALSGLPLTPEDTEHLHKGYVGLLELMQRIPTHWAWAAEPPQVFRADE